MADPLNQPDIFDDVTLKSWVRRYLDTVNLNDAEQMVRLYRADARVEDPVGAGTILQGHEQIRTFYQQAFSAPLQVALEGEPRGSYANEAAYMFRVTRGAMVLQVIGVIAFDREGLIETMRAYHGPSDRRGE